MNKQLASRFGFWSAAFVSFLSVVYLALLIVYFAMEGFTFPPTPSVQLIGGIVTFLTAPSLLVLFSAIKHSAGREYGILGTLGVSFTTLFVATVGINRFVQLTVIRLSPAGAASEDLARFLPYATDSVMFALEMLGWGFFLSLAALSVAPLFGRNNLGCWIRWLFVLFALFSLVSVTGYATGSPLTAAGFVAWGPVLLALAVLLTVFFYRAPPPVPTSE